MILLLAVKDGLLDEVRSMRQKSMHSSGTYMLTAIDAIYINLCWADFLDFTTGVFQSIGKYLMLPGLVWTSIVNT